MSDAAFQYEDPDDFSADTDVCPDCWGDTDPIDDTLYCSTCAGRGWVYVEMLEHPHLSHADVRYQLLRQAARDRGEDPDSVEYPGAEIRRELAKILAEASGCQEDDLERAPK